MKLLATTALFAAAFCIAAAEKMRMGVMERSQILGMSPNARGLFGRQSCSLGTECDDGGCCDLLEDCCQGGCCRPTTYCDPDPDFPDQPCVCLDSCPSGSASGSVVAPSSSGFALPSSSSAGVSFGSSTSELPSASSDAVSGGGNNFNAATGIHANLGWVGVLGMTVAGGMGVLAIVL